MGWAGPGRAGSARRLPPVLAGASSAWRLSNPGAARDGRPRAPRRWTGCTAFGRDGGRGLDSAIPQSRELSGGGRWIGARNPTARLDAERRACSPAISGPRPPLTCLMLLSVKWEREHPPHRVVMN